MKKWILAICSLLFPALAYSASNQVEIYTQGEYLYVESNGIPDHQPGTFPNRGNPNSISEQNHLFRVTRTPHMNSHAAEYGHNYFGVALNGVPFDPATAEYWNNQRGSDWNYDALYGGINLGIDQSNAHVQPTGAYHYHGIPYGFTQNKNSSQPILIGFAADGFHIYYSPEVTSSYRVKKGTRLSGPGGKYDGTYVADYEYVEGSGDLDECNGRVGVTSESRTPIYHYYLTKEFPSIPRCFRGTPDPSFEKQGHGGARGGQGRRGGQVGEGVPRRGGMPPREAQEACSSKSSGQSCSFRAPHGSISGVCRSIQGALACVPSR